MLILLWFAVGAVVGGLARLLLPGRRDLSGSATVLAGLLGSGTLGVAVGEVAGEGAAGWASSLAGAVLGAAALVLVAESANRRARARAQRVSTSDLVGRGESARLEFKSTARYNLHTSKKDPIIELAIARSIAGLANAHGGTLLIGVDDDGRPLGLEADLQFVKGCDLDGFEFWLYDLLGRCLGRTTVRHLDVRFDRVSVGDGEEHVVCRVDVSPADAPVYLRPHAGDRTTRFPVRSGNSTRLLDVDDAVEYVMRQWPQGPLARAGTATRLRFARR